MFWDAGTAWLKSAVDTVARDKERSVKRSFFKVYVYCYLKFYFKNRDHCMWFIYPVFGFIFNNSTEYEERIKSS